jgi:hypothetical protein
MALSPRMTPSDTDHNTHSAHQVWRTMQSQEIESVYEGIETGEHHFRRGEHARTRMLRHPTDVGRVIGDTECTAHELSRSLAGPLLTAKARGIRSMVQQSGDLRPLLGGQLGGGTRRDDVARSLPSRSEPVRVSQFGMSLSPWCQRRIPLALCAKKRSVGAASRASSVSVAGHWCADAGVGGGVRSRPDRTDGPALSSQAPRGARNRFV